MLVKVWNDNVHPYTEKFRGQEIHIPAKSAIDMDHNEASLFLGVNPGTGRYDANGIQTPESYKMLRIEKFPKAVAPVEAKKFVCMADGKEFPTQEALDAYIEENHADKWEDEEAATKSIAKKRGRPAKGAVNDTGRNGDGGKA